MGYVNAASKRLPHLTVALQVKKAGKASSWPEYVEELFGAMRGRACAWNFHCMRGVSRYRISCISFCNYAPDRKQDNHCLLSSSCLILRCNCVFYAMQQSSAWRNLPMLLSQKTTWHFILSNSALSRAPALPLTRLRPCFLWIPQLLSYVGRNVIVPQEHISAMC